jgi:ATP-dependent helicase HrpA
MVRDKVAWTMKALPKRIRTQLVPVPEHVTRFLERTQAGARPVREAVLEYASRLAGERLDADVFSKEEAPPHLRMNIRVVDEAKRELAMGRDLGELRARLGEAASLTLAKAKPGMEREGITAWDFGELPEQVTFKRGNQTLTGYPALVDDGSSASIRLFDTRDKAEAAHREGVKRLLAIELKEQVKNLDRALPGFNALALRFNAVVPADKLRGDLVAAIVDRAFIGDDPLPRDKRAFEEQKKRAKARLPAVTEGAARYANAIGEASQKLAHAIAQSGALGRVTQEVKAQRDRMVYPGFLSRTPWEHLEHVPRYLNGYALRLQKYRANAERDAKHAATVQSLWQDYESRAEADRAAERTNPKLEEYRWLIEELRVSLFAQELRTPFPVSAKRLARFRDENLR